MKTLELKNNIFWNGILDSKLRVFDIIMETQFGTTYNSYIVKGSEKTALVETAKEKFVDEYIESIKDVAEISDIDYIIVNHTEPDHAGSAAKLLQLNPEITVVGSMGAIGFLKQITNSDFKSIAVKEGDTLSLGDKTMRFFSVPNLHWPDTIYTYIEEDKVLFTCDSFGSHYSHDGILRSTVENTDDYMSATKYYFDNIIGPFKPFMKQALKKIENLEIEMICPGHGPVLDSHIDEIKNIYAQWCEEGKPFDKPTVVIPYVTAYGYTEMLAKKIASAIEEEGIDVLLYNMQDEDAGRVLADITRAQGVLFGSPTILSEALPPILNLTSSMCPVVHGKKCASAFGSYGWSGEAVGHIMERLVQLKMKTIDGFRIRFKPSDEELEGAYKFGKDFANLVLGK